MTKFKISILTVLMLFITSSIFISCSNEDDSIIETTELKYSKFHENFPNPYSNISYKNIQEVHNDKNSKSTTNVEGVTFPIIDDNLVIGRYFGTNDQSVAVYIDYSDYQNQITIYNVNDPTEFKTYEMEFDKTTNEFIPVVPTNEKSFWCVSACTIASAAIVLSDGPLPVMDYIGVAHQIACLANCDD